MLTTVKQLWHILTPLDKRKLLLTLVLVMIMALIEAAGVVSIMPFLAVLSNPKIIESNTILYQLYQFFSVKNTQQFILYLGSLSLLIVVISTAFKILTQYTLNRFASLQRHYFSTRLLKIYLNQNYEFFIQRNSSVLIKNILSEVDQLIWTMILPALNLMSYGVVLIAMIAILLIYDPIMAISTACILGGFYFIIYWIVRKKLDQIGASFTEANTERYQSCQEALGGIKDVIINDATQGYIDNFEYYSRIFANHIATRDTLGQIPLYIIETVGYGCLIILAIVLVMSGKDVSHILPILGLYGFAAYRMLPAAQNMYRAITQIKFSNKVLSLLTPEFALESRSDDLDDSPTKTALNFKNKIVIKNLCFSYPNRADKAVLSHLNFEIAKNSSIGIIGKSGSGKSTLMDIMLGLLTPQTGEILIDNITLNKENIASWQHLVGYVPQSIYLADKSISENIAFGIPKDQIDFKQVAFVAKHAQIHEFVTQQLPQGYDTIVGERGVMLSGGQRQRIGIARALYKNPQILFMDEATSALDVETEQAVNEAIQALSGQKTMVIIAHRESAVAKCDRILKLGE
ncbi:ABC transporter ATP-binding protein [Acinetobacter qingfengensis]|uniref:ABC transporter ATP-binding protein n=1 Tax=Acinetobacter qingfengensis TaxID=1262585 RepID=A0A1E7R167_9GAMM|nr:ABC transporter ATP-binding protein [Acinetobacter qingfengensis]KAA8733309.1 ABC transporter ATP-binding protein [Acinetobacter qingfengensis]OEY93060.1 ABC transporter ATP-binding protein [Acinetobacter qingfengensis]